MKLCLTSTNSFPKAGSSKRGLNLRVTNLNPNIDVNPKCDDDRSAYSTVTIYKTDE